MSSPAALYQDCLVEAIHLGPPGARCRRLEWYPPPAWHGGAFRPRVWTCACTMIVFELGMCSGLWLIQRSQTDSEGRVKVTRTCLMQRSLAEHLWAQLLMGRVR